MLHDLVRDWRECEQSLGVEIDARVFAYLRSDDDSLDHALAEFAADVIEVNRRQWRFSALFSLLWPRGGVVRAQRLFVYNPFANLPGAERDLVRDCLRGAPEVVLVTDPNWGDRATDCLIRESTVVLRANPSDVGQLRAALLSMTTEAVDTGFLLLHPRVRGVERAVGAVDVILDLAEGLQ
jgi:hypothetical protein